MPLVVPLLFLLTTSAFESTISRVLAGMQINDWKTAASGLDEAYVQDPAAFAANNFHYLRGRIAENQADWSRAREEFKKIGPGNPLQALAAWHAARASVELHDDEAALEFLAMLPRDFPIELTMQLAHDAGGALSLRIYEDLPNREARFQRAKAAGDRDDLRALIRENRDDDVALKSASLVAAFADSAPEQMEIASVFANHRHFEEAVPLYRQASANDTLAAEARYQIARAYFQLEKYQLAIDDYLAIAKDFEGTDWQKESEYQIAMSYWRLADYENAEKSYLDYIRKHGRTGIEEAATRNLIDVYRARGENQKALTTVDRALAGRLSAAARQVLLFTKAKILYTQKRYAAALALFEQLGRSRLRSAPGAATAEEVEYFKALCQFNLKNKAAANAIWQKLARNEFSYYGQRSAEKLGRKAVKSPAIACSSERSPAIKSMESDLASLRHALRNEMDSTANPAAELIYLGLWDEAAYWMDSSEPRLPRRSAAQISYLGGQFNRAISQAGRLPRTASTMPLIYPAGYHRLICEAARPYKIDPLWMHAIIWQESKYDPVAKSGAAARGLMQFIPETAHAVGTTIGMPNLTLDELYNPEVSIQLGAAYWSSLMDSLKTPEMALAAYNGGPGNVQRWRSKSSDPELFVADIGFVETKRYVMAVFAARAAYASLGF